MEITPQKMLLTKILDAARTDLVDALSVPELSAKVFGNVIRVAKIAEELACADGQPHFGSTVKRLVPECEFNMNAKNLHAAMIAYFMSGDLAVYDKYRRLHSTHTRAEATRQALEAGQEHMQAEREHLQSQIKTFDKLKEALMLSAEGGRTETADLPELPPMSDFLSFNSASQKEANEEVGRDPPEGDE